ncbi:MAG: carbon storage regulator CsrA [Vallitaleaceae bacterium]|jgi:carbon storage regulator|nr:carbon storage regulator CsrA [Vallitaleaceae bacterium]
MLALSRKIGESIIIDDQIEVTVLSITKDQIKLGIDAPKHIKIHRKEIYLQIQEENKAAALINNDTASKLKAMMNQAKFK